MKSHEHDRDLLATATAFLLANGLTQQEIVFLFSEPTNPTRVSRLVKYAEEEMDPPCLDRSPRFIQRNVEASRMSDVRALISSALERIGTKGKVQTERFQRIQQLIVPDELALLGKLNALALDEAVTPIRELRIFDSGGKATDDSSYNNRLSQFGRSAAQRIHELLPRMRNMGLTWGQTIFELVRHLRYYETTPSPRLRPIEFVPLCGEPLDHPVNRISSSSLVAELHATVNGDTATQPISLGGTPCRIPKDFSELKSKVLREFIGRCQGYARVFTGKEPLADRLDCIVTSAGPIAGPEKSVWLRDTMRAEGVTERRLRKLSPGDLGGVLLPFPGLPPKEIDTVPEMNERWTGVTIDQMRRCATRANLGASPGVIFVAVGQAKAQLLVVAAKHGLINEALIDQDLADKLLLLL